MVVSTKVQFLNTLKFFLAGNLPCDHPDHRLGRNSQCRLCIPSLDLYFKRLGMMLGDLASLLRGLPSSGDPGTLKQPTKPPADPGPTAPSGPASPRRPASSPPSPSSAWGLIPVPCSERECRSAVGAGRPGSGAAQGGTGCCALPSLHRSPHSHGGNGDASPTLPAASQVAPVPVV